MLKNILIVFTCLVFSSTLIAQSGSKLKLANSYERSGSYTDAIRLYEQVYEETGNNKAFNGLIRGYKYLNMNNELLELLKEKVKTNKNPELLVLLGEAYWKAGKVKEANASWESAINDAKAKEYLFIELSKIQTELQLLDKAISTLEKGRELLENNVNNSESLFVNELSKLYIANGQTENALSEIFKLLDQTGNIATVEARIYTLMTTKENMPIIREYINDYANKRSSSFIAFQLKSWFHMNVDEYDKALESIVEADDIANNEARMVYEFAKESERNGQLNVALKAYQNIVDRGRSNRFFSSATYNYTRALETKYLFGENIEKDKAFEIIERYETIIEEFQGSNTAGKAYLAKAKIESEILNDISTAIETLNEMNQKLPAQKTKADGIIFLSKLYLINNESKKALNLLKQSLDKYSRLIPEIVNDAKYQIAQINYLTGNADTAKVQLQNIDPSGDDDIFNNILEMNNILNENEKHPNFVKKYADAEYKLLQRDTTKSLEILNEIFKEMEDKDSEIWQKSGILISETHIEQNNFEAALMTTKRFISTLPDGVYSDKALMIMGKAHEMRGNIEEAIKSLTKILVEFPNSIYLDEVRQKIRNLRGES